MARFNVDFTVRGQFSLTIEADSKEDAERKVTDMCEDDEFGLELDQLDDINFRIQQMFKIRRDGKELYTTYVRASDEVVE